MEDTLKTKIENKIAELKASLSNKMPDQQYNEIVEKIQILKTNLEYWYS